MQFIRRNAWTLCGLTAVILMAAMGDASAQAEGDLMGKAQTKAANVFKAVKNIIFVLGGFGLVGIAAAAVFGKVDWKKFAYLAVGLAILAAAGAIVQYATQDSGSKGQFDDSFK